MYVREQTQAWIPGPIFTTMMMSMEPRSDLPGSASRPARLYRQYFTSAERQLLDRLDEGDGSSEFNLLRVLLVRAVAASRRLPCDDMGLQSVLLSAFSRAALNLASLTRFRIARERDLPNPALDAFAVDDVEDL